MCFNGDHFPGLLFLSNPTAWRWHILGQKFSTGTECRFTAEIEDGFRRKMFELSTSCMIGDEEDNLIFPATCTSVKSSDQECSCHCNEGFEVDYDIPSILSCISKYYW